MCMPYVLLYYLRISLKSCIWSRSVCVRLKPLHLTDLILKYFDVFARLTTHIHIYIIHYNSCLYTYTHSSFKGL